MELFQLNSKDNSNFKMMGVINITPDSFSDGGKYTSLPEIKKQIEHFRLHNCKYFDFGAESTAPFNSSITSDEELQRFAPLFELIKVGEFRDDEVLSFDTYKVSTFKSIISLVRECGLNNSVIFNDVSGVLDEELYSLMNEYEFDYVYSHCLAPSRAETSNHMNYISDKINLLEYFNSAKVEFSKRGLMDRVIFDPCFGFSKTAEQNLELIDQIQSWISPNRKWLLGISRKSFLQGLSNSEKPEAKILFSELLHTQILANWMELIREESVLIRLHDPEIFERAQLVK